MAGPLVAAARHCRAVSGHRRVRGNCGVVFIVLLNSWLLHRYRAYVQQLLWGLTGWLIVLAAVFTALGVWRFRKRVLAGGYSPKPKYVQVVTAPGGSEIALDFVRSSIPMPNAGVPK